jgi:hypothetical protein
MYKNLKRSKLYAKSKLQNTISTLKLVPASRFEWKKQRKTQKDEEKMIKPHEKLRTFTSNFYLANDTTC